jgi:hypothetical protein
MDCVGPLARYVPFQCFESEVAFDLLSDRCLVELIVFVKHRHTVLTNELCVDGLKACAQSFSC